MSALGEFALIRRYFTPAYVPAHVSVGVGDDCAVLKMPAGHELAVSIDTQVAGVHFPVDADPENIAARALRCAASDLAAMGAEPLGFTLALTLPLVAHDWLEKFSAGLHQTAEQLSCPLIGGDTTRGPLTVTVQVHGSIPAGAAIKRSGATIGDKIWVSGSLGDGAAALALIENNLVLTENASNYLQLRFYQPAIEFSLAVKLRAVASSCIDVSDGLLADLGHICEASNVGAIVQLAQLPIASVWRDAVSIEQARQWALTGGDDYRLCFTAAEQHTKYLALLPGVTCIGDIVIAGGIDVQDENGLPYSVSDKGFQHF